MRGKTSVVNTQKHPRGGSIMDNAFKKRNVKIIDTIKCNGRYRDVETIRTKILSASTCLVVLAGFVVFVLLM